MIASLEGLRGMAALFVILHHMFCASPHAPFANAYLAVDLFFVLSGFVICRACGAQLSSLASLRTFMIRRIGRLWPTHIATTLLALVVARHVPSLGEALALATMSQGLSLFQAGIGNPVSWSAGDELYVYLLFGAICLLLLRGPARIALGAALAMTAYVFAVRIEVDHACLLQGGCFSSLVHKYGWLRCIAGFFLGTVIYEFQDRVVTLTNSSTFQVMAFSAAFFLLTFADALPGSALAAPLVFAALIGSLIRDRGPIARIFQTRPAQYLGKISYPLYLGHGVLLLQIAMATAGTDLSARVVPYALFLFWSFGIAHLLHKYIEVPFRDRFNRWSRATPRSTAAYAPMKEPQ